MEGGETGAAPLLSLPGPQERYYVLYIRPSRIHRRKFDLKGNEIEPNFSATRKVNTGFLMSSYSRCPLPPRPHLGPCCTVAFLCVQASFGRGKGLLSMVGFTAHVWPEGPPFTQGIPVPHLSPKGLAGLPNSCRLLQSGGVIHEPGSGSNCLCAGPRWPEAASIFLPNFPFGSWALCDFIPLSTSGGRRTTSAVCPSASRLKVEWEPILPAILVFNPAFGDSSIL